jgi:Tfp pilus assembly protein PilX
MRQRSRQAGVALVIGMIMLILLTIIVVSAINSGMMGLRIAGNVQAQDEARALAQQAIERHVSVYANFYPAPQPTTPTTTGYDINNDGTNDYNVTIATPVCKRAAHQIPPKTLQCASGVKSGIYCWDVLWEVKATATDVKSGVSQVVTQGTSITSPPDFQPSTVGC